MGRIADFWYWWRDRRQVHECTDTASAFGGYLCSCGAPWLIFANRCMSQPGRRG